MIDIMKQMPAQGMRLVETLPLLFQGENNAHRFIIVPAEGVDFTGCEIQGKFVRADNTQVSLIGGVVSGNAEIVLTGECYNVAGRAQLTVYAIQNNQAVAIYAAVGNVFPSLGGAAAPDNVNILDPYPVRRMLADQLLRTWWMDSEGATVNYYGATISMNGNEITFNGTMTGDNSVGPDTDWEDPTEPEDDRLLDLTRGLKHYRQADPLLLYFEPHHLYRYSAAVMSGSMEFHGGNISGSVQEHVGVVPIMTYGRHTVGDAYAQEDTEVAPFAGEWRVQHYKVSQSLINSLEQLHIPYDIHGGSFALSMPTIRDGAYVEFNNYKIGIRLLDVTGFGGFTSYSGYVQHNELKV